MTEKPCKKCGEIKPLTMFHNHPGTYDGRHGQCKACAAAAARRNREENRERYRAYESARYKTPKRKADQKRFAAAERRRTPEKVRARTMVSRHLRLGNMTRGKCEVGAECSGRIEAHHDDYSKPLDVRWLCFRHHREHHGQAVAEDLTK
tara:strand:- start:1168 stop:1614 length:447 start_codon:yes stop_codon:yes gene_type:complete